MKKRILVFDFDGTLTRRDSLLAFIRYAAGWRRLLGALLLMSPRLVLMKLRLADNGRTKERLFARFFRGMPLDEFNQLCDDFACDRADIIRYRARQTMAMALLGGVQVFVVSASVDNWVIPFFYMDGYSPRGPHPIEVVGTQVEVADGRLTGRFATRNCYGAEKVRRLEEALPDLRIHRDSYHVTAYGDSRGDKELLEYADEKHWKPFRLL